MNPSDELILKAAVKAAYRTGPFLPNTINGKVRIPFIPEWKTILPYRIDHYCLVYDPDEQEIVSIECPDGRRIDLN